MCRQALRCGLVLIPFRVVIDSDKAGSFRLAGHQVVLIPFRVVIDSDEEQARLDAIQYMVVLIPFRVVIDSDTKTTSERKKGEPS